MIDIPLERPAIAEEDTTDPRLCWSADRRFISGSGERGSAPFGTKSDDSNSILQNAILAECFRPIVDLLEGSLRRWSTTSRRRFQFPPLFDLGLGQL